MAGMGAGYDLSVSTFSPDGRVYQVEYASKAVDGGSTSLGVVCRDGIILAAEKFKPSPLTVPGTSPRIFAVDMHASIAVGGFIADARELVRRARLEASEYRRVYGEPIPAKVLAEHLALFMHAYTLAWSERPFGAALILAVCNKEVGSFDLYSVDCAGVCYKYFGTALGKGRQLVKAELEKLQAHELTCEEALVKVAVIMHRAHEETKEREMELEIAVLGQLSDYHHQMLSGELYEDTQKKALALLAEEDQDDEGRGSGEDTPMA